MKLLHSKKTHAKIRPLLAAIQRECTPTVFWNSM